MLESDHYCRPGADGKIRARAPHLAIAVTAFRTGAESVDLLSAIQIQHSKDVKLFRDKTPESQKKLNLLRGTALITGNRSAYLWTSGFVPRLQTYAGWEVPNSYRVTIQWGEAKLETVLKDVLALTKLNFNACIYGDGQPVTLRFADAVGEILTAGHNFQKLRPLPFKFYI
jgi:hypothetical protein